LTHSSISKDQQCIVSNSTFLGEAWGANSAARQYLITVTGFDACSLQPTSGASGEYAGLLVIKKYLEDQGQGVTSRRDRSPMKHGWFMLVYSAQEKG
jgi:hypothetical protein